MTIKPETLLIRPFVVCAVLRGITFDQVGVCLLADAQSAKCPWQDVLFLMSARTMANARGSRGCIEYFKPALSNNTHLSHQHN